MNEERALEQVRILLGFRNTERERLDKVRRYWKGKQPLPAVIPAGAPREVKTMAKIARVNVCDHIVETLAQSFFLDGIRIGRERDNIASWSAWQANRFDRAQSGVHRAGLAYGTSYVRVTKGDTAPVFRPASPRGLTTLYGEDPDWPVWALESWAKKTYRLYDDTHVYFVSEDMRGLQLLEVHEHEMGVCPVVRFRDAEDLDVDDDIDEARDEIIAGQVAPMMNLQDQIDLTSFNLLIAQHYSAFRQRWILGWTANSEEKKLSASASKLWTFPDHPEDIKVGEFSQTELKGYIDSREAALKYAATLSQTPVHELIGELINLSAEALAAAEAGRDRKVNERQTGFGESWEQVFELAGIAEKVEVPNDAQVRWRDTSARAFGAIVDGLGKLATMLGVPPRALWERIPDVTDQDIKRWEAMAAEADTFARLEQQLAAQADEGEEE